MTTIYRAADYCEARVGYSFAESREVAEAYQRNPGFGGATIYRAEVDLSGLLDLSESDDEWADLAAASGIDIDPAAHQHHFARVLPTSDAVCDALAAAGYRWVAIRDDYPAGAITLIPVSHDAADEAEDTMDEDA